MLRSLLLLANSRAEAVTLGELFDQYLRVHAKLRCKSWRNMERCFNSYLKIWSDKDITMITKAEVYELHANLAVSVSPTTANRVLELLHMVYRKGNEIGWIDHASPAAGIKKFKLRPRDRFLDQHEVSKFFDAVDSLRYPVTKDFILMCLFTGARRSNVASMQWKQINIDLARWSIPETKNGEPQVVPLTAQALAVLQRRRNDSASPWVFPSKRSRSGHITKPEEAWRMVVKRSGLENVRLHDLRRTLLSWQAITGANITVIAATANHKDLRSTQIYARLNVDAVRSAMEKALDTFI